MRIISQDGRVCTTHEVEFCGKIVGCKPDNGGRKKEILGIYENRERAAQVQADIYCANQDGKTEFVMPKD